MSGSQQFSQAHRQLKLTTPLGPDALLLTGFSGSETLSDLFHYTLDVLSEGDASVPFEDLLGRAATVRLQTSPDGDRTFNGIVAGVSEIGSDETFTYYQLELVPKLWLLTHRTQSRIFQQQTVLDILKRVLAGVPAEFGRVLAKLQPREYVVQYRESDFAFASRLMEDEGIYYFFKHDGESHTMVLADTPQGHPPTPGKAEFVYDPSRGGTRDEGRVFEWRKFQRLRAGKYTLRDYCFEMPDSHLEAEAVVPADLSVGRVQHKLRLGVNDDLEVYEFPGNFAHRFDGVSKTGGDQSGNLRQIFDDNKRTAKVRIEQESVHAVNVVGASSCRQLAAGFAFTLARHRNADGRYVATSVRHEAVLSANARSGHPATCSYRNKFECIPVGLPFRPERKTRKPVMDGAQTAKVVSVSGDPVCTDKYGRIKVQFHWDRLGKNDPGSSCWVRVASDFAGGNWGFVSIPRVDTEVVVDFLDGDPDRPIVVGRVYNQKHMPPEPLPGEKRNVFYRDDGGNELILYPVTQDIHLYCPGHNTVIDMGKTPSGFYLYTDADWYRAVVGHDTNLIWNGSTRTIYNGETVTVYNGSKETIYDGQTHIVYNDATREVHNNLTEHIFGNATYTADGNYTVTATGKATVKGASDWYTLVMGDSTSFYLGSFDKMTVGDALDVYVGWKTMTMLGGATEWVFGLKEGVYFGEVSTTIIGAKSERTLSEKKTVAGLSFNKITTKLDLIDDKFENIAGIKYSKGGIDIANASVAQRKFLMFSVKGNTKVNDALTILP